MLNTKTVKFLIISLIFYLIILPFIYHTELLWALAILVYFINFVNLYFAVKLKSKFLIFITVVSILFSQSIAIYDSYLFNRTDQGLPASNTELNYSYTVFSIILYLCLITTILIKYKNILNLSNNI